MLFWDERKQSHHEQVTDVWDAAETRATALEDVWGLSAYWPVPPLEEQSGRTSLYLRPKETSFTECDLSWQSISSDMRENAL